VALLPMTRVLFRSLLAGPATRLYPKAARVNFSSCRGRVTNDYPSCIHCGACARRCPAAAIVVGKEPKSWRIDNFACVTCGLCVRICPTKCLLMESERPDAVLFADLAGRVESHVTAVASAARAREARASDSEGVADA
jgi:ech hydrogenase subunit F